LPSTSTAKLLIPGNPLSLKRASAAPNSSTVAASGRLG
jgi:hypothetical protein